MASKSIKCVSVLALHVSVQAAYCSQLSATNRTTGRSGVDLCVVPQRARCGEDLHNVTFYEKVEEESFTFSHWSQGKCWGIAEAG